MVSGSFITKITQDVKLFGDDPKEISSSRAKRSDLTLALKEEIALLEDSFAMTSSSFLWPPSQNKKFFLQFRRLCKKTFGALST